MLSEEIKTPGIVMFFKTTILGRPSRKRKKFTVSNISGFECFYKIFTHIRK